MALPEAILNELKSLNGLTVRQRAEYRKLPDRLKIRQIVELTSDDENERARFSQYLVEKCRTNELPHYGDINGWQWMEGKDENPYPEILKSSAASNLKTFIGVITNAVRNGSGLSTSCSDYRGEVTYYEQDNYWILTTKDTSPTDEIQEVHPVERLNNIRARNLKQLLNGLKHTLNTQIKPTDYRCIGYAKDCLIHKDDFLKHIPFDENWLIANWFDGSQVHLCSPKIETNTNSIGIGDEKRLKDLEDFIDLLVKTAQGKVQIDVLALPIPKKLFLKVLKDRHKGKSHWNIGISAFENVWELRDRKMCGIKGATQEKGKYFLKNILG
ncbi:hypothetical protein AU255_02220 [Methyloprofundus sedimenti]|uniref:Uncharacterized protein n=1 Tax=Methyloprofundus sedimenti TaxID=1420851 RepID=A0A1V8M5B1_9GAMM|nr:hypothetical protein [Methyloprofundus sedimenti]OQK16744.1 hypothetical protein AU255_02220 [Methyloprofundus sedimenti]